MQALTILTLEENWSRIQTRKCMLWKLDPNLLSCFCIKLIWESLQFLVISCQLRPTLARITPSAPLYWNLCISWCQSVPIQEKTRLEKKLVIVCVTFVYGVFFDSVVGKNNYIGHFLNQSISSSGEKIGKCKIEIAMTRAPWKKPRLTGDHGICVWIKFCHNVKLQSATINRCRYVGCIGEAPR